MVVKFEEVDQKRQYGKHNAVKHSHGDVALPEELVENRRSY